MDNDVIKCDVGLGLGDYSTKESPSHQSDSGMSEMSEALIGDDGSQDLDWDSVSFVNNFDDELDQELAGYFTNVPSQSAPVNNSPNSQESSIVHVEAESERKDDCVSVKPVPASTRVLRERTQLPVHPQEEIIRLNKPKMTTVKEPTKVPAVKVVKVVKPPVGSTKEDIDTQVFEALDERNKKNAIQAKLNREKKKMYIQSLENEIKELKRENSSLKRNNTEVERERDSLLEEVEYLKSVLANDSALSGLLKNIGNVKTVKLSSSVVRKRSADHDHDYGSSSKKARKASTPATSGVCLHVDNDSVSLEFCSKCAGMAKGTKES